MCADRKGSVQKQRHLNPICSPWIYQVQLASLIFCSVPCFLIIKLVTSFRRGILCKSQVAQILSKFPTFYRIQTLVTVT